MTRLEFHFPLEALTAPGIGHRIIEPVVSALTAGIAF